MKTHIGLWIDHRKAVLVLSSATEGETVTILSEAEKDTSSPIPEDSQDRKYQNHLNAFYDEVIGHIHDEETVLIFGPGEAKGELEKRLTHTKPGKRAVIVETTDKLTDPQIAAKVRGHFDKHGEVILTGV